MAYRRRLGNWSLFEQVLVLFDCTFFKIHFEAVESLPKIFLLRFFFWNLSLGISRKKFWI